MSTNKSIRCKAITAKGKQCMLKAGLSGYCHIHLPQHITSVYKERLNDIVNVIESTCGVKGWTSRLEVYDSKNFRFATVYVKYEITSELSSFMKTEGHLEIEVDDREGYNFNINRFGLYSHSREFSQLHNAIMREIDHLPWVVPLPKGKKSPTVSENEKTQSKEVFIVHGHNEEMKQSVARMLEKLGLIPIILHEQPNKGRTIIEKFETHATKASFAIVLLSDDDLAFQKDDNPENAQFRARQNVILELGFFLGKLGRSNVISLFREVENFDLPSDYDGVLYIPFDENDKWQFDVVRELKTAGFDVDANKLID